LSTRFFPIYDDQIDVGKELLTLQKHFHDKPQCIEPTIFVAISSYRDPELCITIEDLFKKAYNPNRIFVGVVEQNDPKDAITCHSKNARIDQSRIRCITKHYKQAKGPVIARSLCESLFNGEQYYCMTDSHMRFEPGWDVALIEMLSKTKRPKRTVITWYCEGYERVEVPELNEVKYKILTRRGWRFQSWKKFNDQEILEFESTTSFITPPKIPQFTAMYSANFAFSSSDVLKEVPYPGNMPYLFFGEELLHSARLYTSGWDLVGMTYSVAYHLWKREYRKLFWEVDKTAIRDQSIQKVKDILSRNINDPKYGLGFKRTIEDYWNYAGVDWLTKTFTRPKKPWVMPKGWKTLQDEFLIQ
jgi:hypothetical protein